MMNWAVNWVLLGDRERGTIVPVGQEKWEEVAVSEATHPSSRR